MPETYDQYLQRRGTLLPKPEQEHGLGSSFVSGLTLGYAGENPQTIPELLSYGAGSVLPYVAAEFASEGAATPLLSARTLAALRAFKATSPVLSSMAKQGAIFGTLGALQKPQEGDSRLLEGAKQAALGAAFPVAGAALKPLWQGIAPYIMPASYVAKNLLPEEARGPVSAVVKRLISGERNVGQLESQGIEQLGSFTEGLKSDQLRQVLTALQGKTASEAQSMLPPELFTKFQGIRDLLNREWAGQQSALIRSETEKLSEKLGRPLNLGESVEAIRGLKEKYPLTPPVEGYYPRGASANYFVLVRQADGTLKLTPGSRDVARTYAEAEGIAREKLAQGIPQADIKIMPRTGFGAQGPQQMGVSRPAFWTLVSKLAQGQGLKPNEFLEHFGEELPIRMKGTPWQGGKFAGFRQQRRGILGTPDADLNDLVDYLGQSARFRALTPALAYAGRQKEGIMQALGGEKSRFGEWFDKYLGAVSGKPTKLESFINDATMQMAEQGMPLAKHFAGDPFAMRRLAGAVRGFTGVLKLGFSPAAAAWNLAQLSNTAAVTGPRNTLKAIWETLHNPEKWIRLWDAAGVQPMSSKVAELTLGDLRGKFGLAYKPAMWLFSKSENFNQRASAIAGYLAAAEKGMPESAARAMARDVLLRSQFHYGQADIPSVMRGPFGKILLQFKPFVANQIAFMLGLSRKEAALYFPMMAALAGTGAIPGKDEIDSVAKMFTGEQPISEIELSHPRATSGLPGLLGLSTQQALGITQGALPTGQNLERLLGPSIGSAIEAGERIAKGDSPSRILMGQSVAGRRIMRVADLLATKAVRSPETGELIYRMPGTAEFSPHKPATLAESKRLNIERLQRQLGYTPRIARGRAYGRYQAAESEKTSSPNEAMLAFMMLSGFTPTALRAELLAGNLTADDIARVLAMQRKGETPQEMLDSMRQLR